MPIATKEADEQNIFFNLYLSFLVLGFAMWDTTIITDPFRGNIMNKRLEIH